MTSVNEIAQDFTALLRAGEFDAAAARHCAADVTSVEPGATSDGCPVTHRRNPIWSGADGIDDLSIDGPFVTGDQFALFLDMMIVDRDSGAVQPFTEIALYTVRGARITEERYFYD
ncbi:MAG: hypothetical protein RLZZ58_142 [Pseudomonadota bacterium]